MSDSIDSEEKTMYNVKRKGAERSFLKNHERGAYKL